MEVPVASGRQTLAYFQDTWQEHFQETVQLPIKAVAAITCHNTSGIMSEKMTELHHLRDLKVRYATWDMPIEKLC